MALTFPSFSTGLVRDTPSTTGMGKPAFVYSVCDILESKSMGS